MIKVTLRRGEGVDPKIELDKALKRLKAKIDTEGVLDTVRAKRAFETPKQKTERKKKLAIKKAKMQKR
jgi:small subunit ribosomal protein S21